MKPLQSWEKILFNAGIVVVSGTGIVLFYMKYCMSPMDEYAVINHPWQPLILKLHIIFSPLLLLQLGYLLAIHAIPFLKKKIKAALKTGFFIIVFILPMVISGYGIQVVNDDFWLSVMSILHISFSFIFLVLYLLHYLVSKRAGLEQKFSKILVFIFLFLLLIFF